MIQRELARIANLRNILPSVTVRYEGGQGQMKRLNCLQILFPFSGQY